MCFKNTIFLFLIIISSNNIFEVQLSQNTDFSKPKISLFDFVKIFIALSYITSTTV
ncbi:MAG: hypothetical protein LBQ24_00240 [Candidatus Peribacteria bacterium]|nr:hypothetical protein [Candidatus Peribacteria bacterium]